MTNITAIDFSSPHEFLQSVITTAPHPKRLSIVADRAMKSQQMREKMSVEHLAFLLLMCRPTTGCPWKDNEEIEPYPTEDIHQIDLDPRSVTAEQLVRSFHEADERRRALGYLVQREFFDLNVLLMSGWKTPLATHYEEIISVYGDENPFINFNKFLHMHFHHSDNSCPWHLIYPSHSWDILRELAINILDNWIGAPLGAFRIIANVYVGRSTADELHTIQLDELVTVLFDKTAFEWSDTHTHGWHALRERGYSDLNPVMPSLAMNVLSDWASGCFLGDAGILWDNDEEYDRKRNEAILLTIYGVETLYNRLAHNSVELTADLSIYIHKLPETPMALLPNFNEFTFAYFMEYMNEKGEIPRLGAALFQSILKLQRSGKAPPSIFSLFGLGLANMDFLSENGFNDECASLWTSYVLIGNIFDEEHMDWLESDAAWNLIPDLIQGFITHGLFNQADQFFSMWLFFRILILTKPVYHPWRLAKIAAQIPSNSRSYIDNTLSHIIEISKSDKNVEESSRDLLVFLQPNNKSNYQKPNLNMVWSRNRGEADIRRHLEEVFTVRLWSGLPIEVKEELLQAERQWSILQSKTKYRDDCDGSPPERAIFLHWCCALESEIKLSLQGVIDILKNHFTDNPVGHDHHHYHLQKTVTSDLSLGNLLNLIIRRKKKDKLRDFPELLSAINESGLAQNTLSDPDKRMDLERVSSDYRNVAAHASSIKLGTEDAAALRAMLFSKGLFAEIVKCRLDQPIRL